MLVLTKKDIEECVSILDVLVKDSELIVTATTSETPVVPDDTNLLRGKHYIGLGSYKPGMREYPDALFELIDEVIVDTNYARQESGDIRIPLEKGMIKEDKILRLGEVITGEKEIDITGTTFFKSVGMALFDLLTAEKVYNKAIEKGIGTQVEF